MNLLSVVVLIHFWKRYVIYYCTNSTMSFLCLFFRGQC